MRVQGRETVARRWRRGALAAVCVTAALAVADADAASKRPPNVMLIMADDMGFSDPGCYGGEIRTPNLDRLAAGGIRFSQHYSTARCWPSRATILTGYYAQQVRRDTMPGVRRGNRPAWAPLLPVYLKEAGYRSYHSGKWHLDGKPLECGFDRSYTGIDSNRLFSSEPWEEDGVQAPVRPGDDYYATVAIVDHAVQSLKLHGQKHRGEPFFQYVAFITPHFPLHAIKEDIDRFRDEYLVGWDEVRRRRLERMRGMGIVDCGLSRLDTDVIPKWNLKPDKLTEKLGPGEVPRAVPWDTLTEEQKRFQATKMAVHAAMVYRMDREIGRLIEQLEAMGEFENTVILFVSDNGASAEQIVRGDGHDRGAPLGSAKTFACLGPGWSTASNTPFRLHKMWNHEGGIASPLIVHWPEGIAARGDVRHDPSHFIDIVPTVLELAGLEWKETYRGIPRPPTPGVSLVPAFARDGAVRHEFLWWCHAGNRAIRMGDWKLVSLGKGAGWELYDMGRDRSEAANLIKQHPEIVRRLDAKWNETADHFRGWLSKGGKQRKK